MMLLLVVLAVVASAEKGKDPPLSPPVWKASPGMKLSPPKMMEPDCVVIGQDFDTMAFRCLSALLGDEMTAPMPATACAGPCLQFMTNQQRWRQEIQWCFNKAAEEEMERDPLNATRIRTTPKTTERVINFGCSVNQMWDFCANTAAMVSDPNGDGSPCPVNQTVADEQIAAAGCCVGSFVEILRMQASWGLAPSCPKLKTGKPCKTAKWNIPKMPAPWASPLGKGKKAALGIGVAAGGIAAAAVIGMALRRRKTKQVPIARASKTSGTTGNAQPVVLSV
jgi:hypothetical protein